jgi:AraC-like DNA-binding protein
MSSIKFLFDGLIGFKIITILNGFSGYYIPFLTLGIPSLYLYFKNLAKDTKIFNKMELKHFIFPLFLGFYNIYFDNFYVLSYSFPYLLFIIYYLFYVIITFKLLKKNIWNRKKKLFNIDQQNSLLIKWTTFLFVLYCLISLRLLISLFLEVFNHYQTKVQNYQWITAILLNFIYLKILYSPKILYGYNVLYKKIKNHLNETLILSDFWHLNPVEAITNNQDKMLKEKIDGLITDYLQNIETLLFRNKILRNPEIGITELATKLKIPKSHITFVFKYHSKVSFVEFKKIIRIYDALNLIEENYLKSNTLESLATKVGFASYNPFFITFKDITGTTPQIYCKERLNS